MAATLNKFPLYPEEKEHAPTTVCVTGVTGFLAGAVVSRLLAAGHTVRGTCRDPTKKEAVGHLTALPGAAERLRLFKADLLQEGGFDEAMQGCEYVLHTASPYINNVPTGEVRARLIEPAVRGTENVLGAASRTASVKRVVLTSSCAAIYGDPHERGRDHVYTEEDWNPTSSETVMAYSYSKTLAERKAWQLAQAQSRWQLVVINPAVILGPPTYKRADSESITIVNNLLKGEGYPGVPHMGFGAVDVRDVAAAHCLAMVHTSAKGRYICVSRSITVRQIAEAIKRGFPDSRFKLPIVTAPKWLLYMLGPAVGMSRDLVEHNVGKVPQFNNSKIQRELGFKFSDMDAAVTDQVDAMLQLGIAKPF